MQLNNWAVWAVIVVGGVIGLALLSERLSVVDETDGQLHLLYLILLLTCVGGGVLYRFKTNMRSTLAQLAIWIALFAGLILAYSYKDDFAAIGQRFVQTLNSRGGVVTGTRSVSFSKADSDHYEVTAKLDGVPITFFVDTGATSIVLTPQAAERLGYDLNALNYDIISQTANGLGRSAAIKVNEFVMGPIVMHDLSVHVNLAPMSHSLLGMEFLSRLKSMRTDGDTLTFEQ